MSELKHIRVREAKIRDIGLLKKLWTKLLEKQKEEGSIIKVNEKTLNFYENLFNVYVTGEHEGLVIFVADKGVLMWGDPGSPLDLPGKLIMAWGVYIEPEFEELIKKPLFEYALNWLKEHKFTGILTEKYEGSQLITKPSIEFKPVSTLMYHALGG